MFSLQVDNDTCNGKDGFHVTAEAHGTNNELYEEMAVGVLNLISHMSGHYETNVILFFSALLGELI